MIKKKKTVKKDTCKKCSDKKIYREYAGAFKGILSGYYMCPTCDVLKIDYHS